MLVDKTAHQVTVRRTARHRDQAERACRRTDVNSAMEATAWQNVCSGATSMSEYNKICDNILILMRR